MERVATVIVTYNRKEKLRKNLMLIVGQTYKINKIFVIDNNSSDGTYDFIKDIIDKYNIEYVRLEENTGGSGGFSKAIELASESGCDYIWGMDDDAFPEHNALENIINAMKKYGNDNCYWSNCNNDQEFDDEVKLVQDWMFVGFFIPVKVIRKIGLPREDFFIYFDDSEYAYRIIKEKIKIYKVRDSIIIHKDGPANSRKKRLLFFNVTVPNLPDWKFYYFVRNEILKYKWSEKEKYRLIFYTDIKLFIKTLFLNYKQLHIFIKGYFHGIFGISGIKMRP